jgi:hypothetical protein
MNVMLNAEGKKQSQQTNCEKYVPRDLGICGRVAGYSGDGGRRLIVMDSMSCEPGDGIVSLSLTQAVLL